MADLSPTETAVINQLQGGFPIARSPFAVAAATLGLEAETLRSTVADLLARKVLTRFGPLYQIERMGGQFILAALQVPEDHYDAVAAQVNALDAVAHNYRREHALNMWFVLAAASPAAMQQAITRIEADTGLPVYAFPKEEEYFVGMRFTVGGTQPVGHASANTAAPAQTAAPTLDVHDLALIRATQGGLPLVEEPWQAVADALAWPQTEVLRRMQALLDTGVARRIGVVPNHYAIGYRFNAMAVFDVDDAALPALGPQVGALDFVTHSYRRPRHAPLWPYNLFAMCHGASREAVLAQVQQVRGLLGDACRGHDALFSTRILKKTGLRI